MTISNEKNLIDPNQVNTLKTSDTKAIIIWDTCAILDIMNFVINSRNSNFLKTLLILNELIDEKKILSCSSIIVKTEISENYNKTPYPQAESFLEKVIENFQKIEEFLYILRLGPEPSDIAIKIKPLLDMIDAQIQKLVNNTYFITDDIFLKLARDRVVNKIAPSQKNEFKDSVIWETCLHVSKHNTLETYFISSNDKDYGSSSKRFPIIVNEIESYKIKF